MDNQELLKVMREGFNTINQRLDSIESRLATIEGHTEVTRAAVNSLIEWTDTAAGVVEVKFPIKK